MALEMRWIYSFSDKISVTRDKKGLAKDHGEMKIWFGFDVNLKILLLVEIK